MPEKKPFNIMKSSLLTILVAIFFIISTEAIQDDGKLLGFIKEPISLLKSPNGKRFVFKCQAHPPEAAISWLFNGTLIDDDFFDGKWRTAKRNSKLIIRVPKHNDMNTNRPHLPRLSSLQGGVFQCVISFDGSSLVSRPAKLLIAMLSPFDSTESDQEVITSEGNTALIPCSLPKSIPNAVSEFLRDESERISRSTDRYRLLPSGDLQILDARASDAGHYRCIAHNPFLNERKNASNYVHLLVTRPNARLNSLRFIKRPESHVSATRGTDVVMECVTHADPPAEILWRRIGSPSLPKSRRIGGNLVLKSVTSSVAGTYVCSATSSGQTIEARSDLNVLELPEILDGPSSATLTADSRLQLDCQTRSKPVIITWLWNGEPLTPNNNKEIVIRKTENGSRLLVQRVRGYHSGAYQCFANNELGSVYSYARVKVLEDFNHHSTTSTQPPPTRRNRNRKKQKKLPKDVKTIPPTRPSVSRLSESSVMVRWSVPANDGLPIQFFKIQFREFSDQERSDWRTVDADISPVIRAYAVPDLRSGHEYKFRILAVYSNLDNKNGPSSDRFELLKNPITKPPSLGPVLLAANAVSSSAIALSWEFHNVDDVPIHGFIVHYLPTHTASDYHKVTVESGEARSFILTHLTPSTSYDIKMSAFNDAGTSSQSNIYTSKTLTDNTIPDDKEDDEEVPNENVVSSDDDQMVQIIAIAVCAVMLVVLVPCLVMLCVKCRRPIPKVGADSKNFNNNLSNQLVVQRNNSLLLKMNRITLETTQTETREMPMMISPRNVATISRNRSATLRLSSSFSQSNLNAPSMYVNNGTMTLDRRGALRAKFFHVQQPVDVNVFDGNRFQKPRTSGRSFSRLNGTLERAKTQRPAIQAGFMQSSC